MPGPYRCIRLITRAWQNRLYRLPPKKDYHVYITRINSVHKDSAPRAADAARYARARQGRMQLKTCEGGRKKRPTIWCEQRFDNAKSCLCRASCLVVVLSCAVCFCYRCYVLIGSAGVLCVGEKTGGHARSNTCRKKKRRKVAHNTYYKYCSMFERKDKAQHDTAPQRRAHGTAPHGSARRYAALLGCIKPD